MSTLLHPQGPESEAVYWRRRAVVMIVVILVIAAVSLLVGRIRQGAAQAVGSASATADPTDTAGQTAEPSPSGTAEGQCAVEDLTLEVTVPEGVAAGQAVELTVRVGASGAPCSLDLGEHALSVTVHRDSEEYWGTDLCSAAVPSGQIAIMDADPVPLVLTWPGAHVGQGCTESGEKTAAGSYTVTAGIDGGQEATSQLTLT